MIVHHLNCGTMHPIGGRLLFGSGGLLTGSVVSHCLLIESADGLVLVDTGFGTDEVKRRTRIGIAALATIRPSLSLEQTALHQIRRLGYRSEDVRQIVVSHLDLDHAGGLADFPHADVHVLADELDMARHRPTIHEKLRYQPRQWEHRPRWVTHDLDGERWFGFGAIPLRDGIVLVPLIGHTRGHTGVAVAQDDRWLLYCGDAYFHRDQLTAGFPCEPVGWSVGQLLSDTDRRARIENLERLRKLHADHGDRVRLFCAHDTNELAACKR